MPQPHTGYAGPGPGNPPLWTFDSAGNLVLAGGIATYGNPGGITAGQVTAQPSAPPAGNYLGGMIPSGDTTGAKDSANVNGAVNLGFLVVKLGLGVFWFNQPGLIDQNGVELIGSGGPTQSTDDNSTGSGTIIRLTASFTNPSAVYTGAGVTGALIISDQGPTAAGTPTRGTRVRDLWLDCTLATGVTCDGITGFGAVQSCELRNVGVINPTGNGVNWIKDTSASFGQPFPDGWSCYNVAIQSPSGYGFIGKVDDSLFVGCRSHSAGLDGWDVQGLNCYYVGCRGDNGSGNGFTVDAQPPSGSTVGSPNCFIGCGTQANTLAGMNVTNSSPTGLTQRAPVLITGCMFAGDQTGGSATGGGINVAGRNTVLITGGTTVAWGNNVDTGGCPAYSVTTNTIGSSNAKPLLVLWSSGFANYQTGVYLDSAGIGIGVALQISNWVVTGQGEQPTVLAMFAAALNAASLTLSGALTAGQVILSGAYTTSGSMMSLTNTATTAQSPILYTADAAGDSVVGVEVSGDTSQRFKMDSNGKMSWGSGSATPDTFMSRQAAGILQTTSTSFDVVTAGHGLMVAEGNGSNAKQGHVSLTAGTVTVTNSAITSSSRVFLTAQDNNTTGALRVSSRTAGTSFVITSSNAGDSGVVAYEIFEPG